MGWSWTSYRPALAVVRGTDAVDRKFLAWGTEVEIVVPPSAVGRKREGSGGVGDRIDALMRGLQAEDGVEGFEWRWKGDVMVGVGRSMHGDVWSRRARRRRVMMKTAGDVDNDDSVMNDAEAKAETDDEEEEKEPKFVFKISCTHTHPTRTASTAPNQDPNPSASATSITIRWLQGHEAGIFESFCGWVRRGVTVTL